MKFHKPSSFLTISLLVSCFIIFLLLSWILVLRDPRAIIGIDNLYPNMGIREQLFSLQAQLVQYGLNTLPTILFAITSVVALGFYSISLPAKISLKQTITFALIFQAIMFVSFPILSTDIFSYIMSERVSTIHNENIWQVKPAAFPDDQFAVMADWKDTTSVYGGVHYLLYLIPALVGQNDLVSLVILYKLVPTLFAIGAMGVLYKLLLAYKNSNPAMWLRFVFWNPLFVLEIFGSGHNDSMMIFFALTSWYFFYRKYWLVAGILLALAVQVKLIPVVLFFFCALYLLQNKHFRGVLSYIGGFIGLNILLFSFMQINVLDFLQRVLYNGGVYWQSLPNLLQSLYPAAVPFIAIMFVLWVTVYSIIKLRKRIEPLTMYVTVLLVYLIFVSSAYWNWYVLWIFPFLPFIKDKKVFLVTFILAITSLFAYPLLWVIHRINTPSIIWPVLQYAFIFGPLLLLFLLLHVRNNVFEILLHRIGFQHLIAEKA